jgi:hypothetical protein
VQASASDIVSGVFDEAIGPGGVPRARYAELLVERPEQLALFEALVGAAEARARDAAEAA